MNVCICTELILRTDIEHVVPKISFKMCINSSDDFWFISTTVKAIKTF